MTRLRSIRPDALRLALAASAALPLLGCLEREETITVSPSGTLEVLHVLRGDPAEFGATGDALPAGPAWIVAERDVQKADGRGLERVREARATFTSASDVPSTHGAADDAAPLRFTTKLDVERLAGGAVRYTFERRYAPREWAWRERLLEQALPKALRDELGKSADDPALKRKALAGLLAFEKQKLSRLLEEALAAVHGGPPPTAAVLKARADFATAYDAAWRVDALLEFLGADAGRQAALEARYRDDTLRAAVTAGAAALGDGVAPEAKPGLEARVRAALEQRRRVLEASEDLQDESFTLRVRLPARVETSDEATLEDDGKTVVFRFKGADLNDAAVTLRAVAVSRP